MKVSITFNDCTLIEAGKLVSAAVIPRGGKPGKPAKTDDDDQDFTVNDEETEETETEETEEAEDDGPTLAVVMDAFKKFVKKHKGDKSKAIPILKKFKVKSPNDLEESDYPAVLKLLAK